MSTPSGVLNELFRLQQEAKGLRDKVTRKGEDRRRMAAARIVDRAYLDALSLVTVAIRGGAVGRFYSPLPQVRWSYAKALLKVAGLVRPGRDLRLRLDVGHEEIIARLDAARRDVKGYPPLLVEHLPRYVRPRVLLETVQHIERM